MPATKFRSFAIFGAMRSGSNLLERYINQFDGLKCHGELFNPAFIGWSGHDSYLGVSKSERDDAPNTLLDAIAAQDQDNIPGFRIFREHNSNAIDLFLDDPDCAKIVLTRDVIDSFVSLKIARKTDQWLIHDESHRKTAQIYFDMQEFGDYKKTRENYLQKIIKRMTSSGQQFYRVHYEQLADIDKINELARFIGAKTERSEFEQTIKRQNPGELSEKIVNYTEVSAALGLPAKLIDSPRFQPEKGTDLSRAYFCSNQNIVFAPIPSAPDGSITKWLAGIDGLTPGNNFSRDAFDDWLSNHKNPVVFSVLRHPVARAYDVFMRKIFQAYGGGFVKIREALQASFGIFLPPVDADSGVLADIGYDKAAHRAAFAQFLAFIHHNLNEETDLRTDGRWRPQSDLIDGYGEVFDVELTVKEDDVALLAAYLVNRFALETPPETIQIRPPKMPFELADIYDDEIETLTRNAYAKDYARFDFQNWR